MSRIHTTGFLRTLLALGMLAVVHVSAQQPAFLSQSLKPTARAEVVEIRPAANVDVVYLDGGLDQGFRVGMECQIVSDSQLIAEIVLVEVRSHISAGLILELHPEQGIRPGDSARIKTLSFTR